MEARAQREELELAHRRGTLVEAAGVARGARDCGLAIAQTFWNMAPQIAPVLVGLPLLALQAALEAAIASRLEEAERLIDARAMQFEVDAAPADSTSLVTTS